MGESRKPSSRGEPTSQEEDRLREVNKHGVAAAVPMPRIGGSFAPSLDKKAMDDYRELIKMAPPEIAEAMTTLHNMVTKFNETQASKEQGTPHPSGTGVIVPLAAEEVKRVDPHVPWRHELEMYAKLFDGIDPNGQKELRDAAFHLLWYGNELFLDREPITIESL